jgi:hypothetical protein
VHKLRPVMNPRGNFSQSSFLFGSQSGFTNSFTSPNIIRKEKVQLKILHQNDIPQTVINLNTVPPRSVVLHTVQEDRPFTIFLGLSSSEFNFREISLSATIIDYFNHDNKLLNPEDLIHLQVEHDNEAHATVEIRFNALPIFEYPNDFAAIEFSFTYASSNKPLPQLQITTGPINITAKAEDNLFEMLETRSIEDFLNEEEYQPSLSP